MHQLRTGPGDSGTEGGRGIATRFPTAHTTRPVTLLLSRLLPQPPRLATAARRWAWGRATAHTARRAGSSPPKGNRERMPSWLPAPRTADEATDVPAEGDPPPRLPLPLPIRKGRGSHGNAGNTPRYLPTAGDRTEDQLPAQGPPRRGPQQPPGCEGKGNGQRLREAARPPRGGGGPGPDPPSLPIYGSPGKAA